MEGAVSIAYPYLYAGTTASKLGWCTTVPALECATEGIDMRETEQVGDFDQGDSASSQHGSGLVFSDLSHELREWGALIMETAAQSALCGPKTPGNVGDAWASRGHALLEYPPYPLAGTRSGKFLGQERIHLFAKIATHLGIGMTGGMGNEIAA